MDHLGFLERAIAIITTAILSVFAARVLNKVIRKKRDKEGNDPMQLRFLGHLVTGFVYTIGFGLCIYMVPSLRKISTSIFAGSGVLAIIIGFASQQAFSNIVGGIFIAIFKPFTIGDRIEFVGKNVIGRVEDITLRHTVLKTIENRRIIIPNSVVSSDIIENSNFIEEKICRFFHIGISYDSDINKAMEIIKDEAMKHKDYLDNRTPEEIEAGEHPLAVRALGFGEFSVNLRAWIWAKDNVTAFRMACELNKSIKERFEAEGIEIPSPYRTIVFKDKAVFSSPK